MKLTPERLDAWRVIPRLLVLMFGLMVWRICEWYMALPEPTGAQAAFVSTVIGSAAAWFGFYVNTGRK